MHKVAIIGASGFTGAELLRLCAAHPDFEVVVATGDTQADSRVADLYPSLAGAYRDMTFVPYDPSVIDGADIVFLGLPHGASQSVVPRIRGTVKHVVDLCRQARQNPIIGDGAEPEIDSRVIRQVGWIRREQIVHDYQGSYVLRKQPPAQIRTDEAHSARDPHPHRAEPTRPGRRALAPGC